MSNIKPFGDANVESLDKLPFNVGLLKLSSQRLKLMHEITTYDIFDRSGRNFHEDGLYSNKIFGRPGTPERDEVFGYIDLNVTILHPLIFQTLQRLKALYAGIIKGSQWAKWNDEEKDFVASDAAQGETGYDFFMRHWKDIEFKTTDSDQRKLRIEFIERYKDVAEIEHLLVLPAGIRDIQIDSRQVKKEAEINDLYRSLIATAGTVVQAHSASSLEMYNVPRWTMQRIVNEVYNEIINMMKGKRGWIQQKWARRTTINGTRNTITAMDPSVAVLDHNAPTLRDTQIGFIQTLRGALPITLSGLRAGPLYDVFSGGDDEVWLVNKKTLKRELVPVSVETLDKYTTRTGLEKLINRFNKKSERNRVIDIEGYYLGLIYVDDQYFRYVRSIEDLPSTYDKKYLKPLTLASLLYLSTVALNKYDNLAGTMTRYPITGQGSIYPTFYRVRTTTRAYTKQLLDDNWEPVASFNNFPELTDDARWLDSLVPSLARLERAGADFDGDQFSSPMVYTKEAIENIDGYFRKRSAYVGTDGKFIASAGSKTSKLTAANLTAAPTIRRHTNGPK